MTSKPNPLQPIYDECNAGNSVEKFASLPDFPRLIDVELTNTCNFRCLMCPTGNFSQVRSKGFMDEAVFYRILEQAAEHGTPLRFIRWGEPTSHPQFLEFLKATKEAGLLTHVNTNASYLDEEMMDALVELPLDCLKFSFQGVDRDSYMEMRNTDFFEELIEKITLFHKKRGDNPYPFILVSTTTTYETPEMIESFRQRVAPVCDDFNMGKTNRYHS